MVPGPHFCAGSSARTSKREGRGLAGGFVLRAFFVPLRAAFAITFFARFRPPFAAFGGAAFPRFLTAPVFLALPTFYLSWSVMFRGLFGSSKHTLRAGDAKVQIPQIAGDGLLQLGPSRGRGNAARTMPSRSRSN